MAEDGGSKIIGWTLAMLIVFIMSQYVLSPILGLATGSLESAGLTSFATILTVLAAASDLLGFKLPSFD